jgi:AcrR family transcriptional regulator
MPQLERSNDHRSNAMSAAESGGRAPSLRRDARDNLAKLQAAAVEVFQEDGLGAPLESVAKRAGVSIGTLYNRFGSREALIDASVGGLAAARLDDAVERAGAIGDPWGRFASFVTQLTELQATWPVVSDVFERKFPGAHEVTAICDRTLENAAAFITDAQRSGSLRPDFDPRDLVALLTSNAAIVKATRQADPEAWRRHLGFFLDGIRGAAEPATGKPRPAS